MEKVKRAWLNLVLSMANALYINRLFCATRTGTRTYINHREGKPAFNPYFENLGLWHHRNRRFKAVPTMYGCRGRLRGLRDDIRHPLPMVPSPASSRSATSLRGGPCMSLHACTHRSTCCCMVIQQLLQQPLQNHGMSKLNLVLYAWPRQNECMARAWRSRERDPLHVLHVGCIQ